MSAFPALYAMLFFKGIPLVLFFLGLSDILRSRRSRWWLVSLLVPVVGPLAYFGVTRARGMAAIEAQSAERATAKKHLARLEAQLAHWRGPAVLAEAGEQLLILGRPAEAETRLREAVAAGAEIADTHFALAKALAAERKFAEAIPYLEALLAQDPDHAIGEARALLGACLDETGDAVRAEAELRRSLERRGIASVKLRLARLLVRRGEKEEGARLAAEFRRDMGGLSPSMRRAAAPWERVAKQIEAGRDVPLPRVTAASVARARLAITLVLAVAIFVLTLACVVVLAWKLRSLGRDSSVVLPTQRQGGSVVVAGRSAPNESWPNSSIQSDPDFAAAESR